MKLSRGSTRIVLLVGNYAIKFPHLRKGLGMLLLGVSCNRTEWKLWRHHRYQALCPVLFHFLGIIVMPKVCQKQRLINLNHPFLNDNDDEPNNYGVYRDKIVKIDYGWIARP